MPITLILVILHATVIGAILSISKASSGMTEIMSTYSRYVSDATDRQAGSSRLNETAFSFLLRPVTEEGQVNVNPLVAYAVELGEPRRGSDIQRRFEGRDLDEADKKMYEHKKQRIANRIRRNRPFRFLKKDRKSGPFFARRGKALR